MFGGMVTALENGCMDDDDDDELSRTYYTVHVCVCSFLHSVGLSRCRSQALRSAPVERIVYVFNWKAKLQLRLRLCRGFPFVQHCPCSQWSLTAIVTVTHGWEAVMGGSRLAS